MTTASFCSHHFLTPSGSPTRTAFFLDSMIATILEPSSGRVSDELGIFLKCWTQTKGQRTDMICHDLVVYFNYGTPCSK